jgi:hypothetical protein
VLEPEFSPIQAADLQPASGISASELTELHEHLAEAVGNERIRIAMRDSELLHEGLPHWARGMRPARTLGPFVDAAGRRVSFDVFAAAEPVRVFRAGVAAMLLPAGTDVQEGKSVLALTAGSVWIPGKQLAANAPANAWVGIRVKSGSLEFPAASLFLDGTLSVAAAATLTLHIALDPRLMTGPAAGPGAEAASSDANLPDTATFVFGLLGVESIATDAASLTTFGNAVGLGPSAATASYEPALQMIIVPMDADVPSIAIAAVQSTLFHPAGKADLVKAGWALMVTISQPENLSDAVGAGSLVLETRSGLETSWEGLHGGASVLGRTFVVIDPTFLRVVAPAAVNSLGMHTLELWRAPASSTERSLINAEFRRPFLLWLISQRDGIDAVLATAHLSGHLDRPLRVDGSRFPLEIDGSLVILQRPEGGSVAIEAIAAQGAIRPMMAAALSNALLTITPPQQLFLNGSLEFGTQVESGTLVMASGIYRIVPILPDPYAANFEVLQGRDEPLGTSQVRATIVWPDRDHPALEMFLDLQDAAVPQLLPEATRDGVDPLLDHARANLGARSVYWMLDVSSGADQLGVSLDIPLVRPELQRLTIGNLSLQAPGDRLHTFLLPQFQWEPVQNTANPRTGDTNKILVSPDDGGPSFLHTETVNLVPIAPAPVVEELVRAYNEDHSASSTRFTLPFGMEALAVLKDRRYLTSPGLKLIMAEFEDLTGARQISLTAGTQNPDVAAPPPMTGPLLIGLAQQTENFLATAPPRSTLGQLRQDFNASFGNRVPIERIDLSGYGASIFSRWADNSNPDIGITQVSFDGFNGRTSYERILMVTVLWPCLSRMVRTIILERQGSGRTLRWDSGWLSTSPGRYVHPKFPGTIHRGVVEGMYDIREVRDTDQIISVGTADLQAVYYDADIAFANVAPEVPVVAGQNSAGRVPVRRQLGFIQRLQLPDPLTPASLQTTVLTPDQFDELLSRTGPLGGPVDCTIRIGLSKQTQRITSIETASAGKQTAAGSFEFVVVANGTPVLPAAGRWSVVRVDNVEQMVGAVDAQRGVPLIRRDGGAYRWANPEDLLHEAAAKVDCALLMAHDTQRLLMARPKIEFTSANISTAVQPKVADPYSMLGSTGLFPRVDQAIRLPAATELAASTLKLASGTLNLAAGTLGLAAKPLVNVTSWKATADFTKAALNIDSFDDWKIHLKDVRQRLEYDGLDEIMTVVHDFESTAGDPSRFLDPKLVFGPKIQAAADVLQTLKKLAPTLPGGLGPVKLDASFSGTAFRFAATADFQLATTEGDAVECGMGKAKGDLMVGAELSADIVKHAIGGAVFLQISGSWQQEVFPLLYAGGHVRFLIRADHTGKTTLELDACTIGSVGGTLIPGLVDVEATVKYGYFIQITAGKVRPGIVAGLDGRAKLLSGLLGFRFGVEGRVLIYPEIDFRTLDRTSVRLYGRIRVAGTVTVAWLIEESKSFETDFDERLNWKSILFAAKAGLLPVP